MPSKKSKLKLYADECFPVPAVTYLKSLGYSIIHARDFNSYEEADLKGYPGVIIISAGSTTPFHIIKVCTKVLKNISESLIKESLIKVTIDKIIKVKNGKVVYEKLL